MTSVEYAEFAHSHVYEYARQHVNAAEWAVEGAIDRARSELKDLLNDSLRPLGHLFMKAVYHNASRIGWIWIAPAPEFLGPGREHTRWLSQITVEEKLRGRGYGRSTLLALHPWLSAQGVEDLWLRVYDWNHAARRLYEGAGYELMRKFSTDAHLRKRLAS